MTGVCMSVCVCSGGGGGVHVVDLRLPDALCCIDWHTCWPSVCLLLSIGLAGSGFT